MANHNFFRLRWTFAGVVLLAAFFLVSCGNRSNTTAKPQPPPPPPFEFLNSWGEKGDGPGKLNAPVSIATNTLGDVFFPDPGSGFVHKFQSKGTPLLSFEDPRLRRAAGIAVDAGGAIYVADPRQGAIHVFFPDGSFFQTWHAAPQRQFSGALGMSTDEQGTLYVPDAANSRVQKINNHGHLVKTWPAPEKALNPDERPSWVCAEPDDIVFVAYFGTGRIEKFSSDGSPVTAWSASGTPNGEPGPISGFAVSNEFLFTMAPGSAEIRIWTKDGQPKLRADLGANVGTIAAPEIAATPHGELLVFDPAAPKIFRFRTHLETKEPQ